VIVSDPKTRASVRSVAVDDATLAELEELRRVQASLATSRGLVLHERSFVFSFEPGGGVPPHPDTMSHAFARVRRRAGAAPDLHLHSLGRRYTPGHLCPRGLPLRHPPAAEVLAD
jgi:hypothetical protein